MDRPTVIITEAIHDSSTAWLANRCDLAQLRASDAGFLPALARADGLVVRTYTTVDAEMLDGAPRLRVVGRAGVGLDNIDVVACLARGVAVVHTPDANTQAVVEYVLRLLGEAFRPLHRLDHAVDETTWATLRSAIVAPRQLDELKFGVLGAGRIGSRVAALAATIGCRVIFNDLREVDVPGASAVDVDALFAECDVVSIHVDGRSSNRHFVGDRLLGRMRPDAVLINTSRGFVVDGAALAARLTASPSCRAYLDVHESEPIRAGDPLLDLANAHLYPHLASRTRTAMANMSDVVRDVWAVLDGRPPRWPASLQ
jgi:phosphoglycerate dehydrogenase-like enzyme